MSELDLLRQRVVDRLKTVDARCMELQKTTVLFNAAANYLMGALETSNFIIAQIEGIQKKYESSK